MFDNFTLHWRTLRDAGQITNQEFIRATFAQHYRTVKEFTAPFDNPSSAVRQAGLNLIAVETQLTPCPYNALYHDKARCKDKALTVFQQQSDLTLLGGQQSWDYQRGQ